MSTDNSEQLPPVRDNKGRFLPKNRVAAGQGGGRPPIIRHIRDMAREHTETAFKSLLQVSESGESESARVAASGIILDRGWGKATQIIDTPEDGTLAALLSLITTHSVQSSVLEHVRNTDGGDTDADD